MYIDIYFAKVGWCVMVLTCWFSGQKER